MVATMEPVTIDQLFHLSLQTGALPKEAHDLRLAWPPIYSSAPLSTFEAMVGKLMVQARRACPTKYLPQTEILKIADLPDEKNRIQTKSHIRPSLLTHIT